MEQLVLVDGSSFLYRAFYVSQQNFTNSKGIPTGVCMIMTRMLQNLVKKFNGSKFIVVFDAKGKSFRSELYAEYKANRPPMPESLQVQVSYVHRIVKALGFPLVSIKGVEADDVLGTYAKIASSQNLKTIICTGDKDIAQLVDENVIIYDSMKDVYYDEQGVFDKFGVKPNLIIDFLALKGDSSDNIPGMAGVGDKTALALLNGLGGIEEIANNLDKIATLSFRGSKTFAAKFQEQLDNIRLSYKLATIKTDVQLDTKIEDVSLPRENRAELIELYKELEFSKLLSQLEDEPHENKEEQKNEVVHEPVLAPIFSSETTGNLENYQSLKSEFKLVLTENDLSELAALIKEKLLVAIDTETTAIRTSEAKLVGISLAFDENQGYYLPLCHSYLGVPELLSVEQVKNILLPALNQDKVKVIGHNIKYDLEVLHYAGLELKKPYADTMLLAHLIDSSLPVNLDDLAGTYLSYKTISYKELIGDKKRLITEIDIESVGNYAAEDAEVTLRLFNKLQDKLQNKKLNELFFELEMPLLNVLYRMELNGVYVDEKELARQNDNLKLEFFDLQKQIYIAAGKEFNISSPKQLAAVLFEDLAIPYPKKTANKKYSTAEDILQLIAYDYDIANLVLRYRELSKLITTYTDKLPYLIDKNTNRIYASFNQAGTVTGRLSSSEPNLQNIPARSPEGRAIRKSFTAPKGYTLMAADYSQIELRLIAHISHDPNLVKAFRAGHDIHSATAAEVLGKDISAVTKSERSHAKATNFGLMYGMGAFGLTQQTHMSMSEAKQYIQTYFERYPLVKDYMEKVKEEAHQQESVTTIVGRQIAIANINSTNARLAKGAERAAINAPMQGSAADIIKLAMIELQNWIDSLESGLVRMTVQVHDELLFEVRDDFVEDARAKIKSIMENALALDVPLTVEVGVGENWADAH